MKTERSFITISVACLVATLFAAILLLESDQNARTTTRLAVLGYALLCCALPVLALSNIRQTRRIGLSLFLVANAYWFAVPAGLQAVQDGWFGEELRHYIAADDVVLTVGIMVMFVVCFASSYSLTILFRRGRRLNANLFEG